MSGGERTEKGKPLNVVLIVLVVLIAILATANVAIFVVSEQERIAGTKNVENNDSYVEEVKLSDNPFEEGTAEYYRFLVKKTIDENLENSNGNEIVGYAIMVDDIEQSVDSAAFVISTASYYNMDDVVNKYMEIHMKRKVENGFEYVGGGAG